MTANQFYVPAIAPDAAQIVLRGEEHRHLARTARVRAGEEVWLFDATGRHILRAETAALAGALLIIHFWNE